MACEPHCEILRCSQWTLGFDLPPTTAPHHHHYPLRFGTAKTDNTQCSKTNQTCWLQTSTMIMRNRYQELSFKPEASEQRKPVFWGSWVLLVYQISLLCLPGFLRKLLWFVLFWFPLEKGPELPSNSSWCWKRLTLKSDVKKKKKRWLCLGSLRGNFNSFRGKEQKSTS